MYPAGFPAGKPASVQNGRRPGVIFGMSAVNRAARGSIKIPWNKFGYDRLPERFSRSLPGSKRKKKPRTHEEWPIVRGDLVQILSGKDEGKQGKVKDVIRSKNTIIVAGLNTEIQKLDETDATPGTYVRMEEPLPYKDVALVDPSDKQPTAVSFRYTELGERVRVSDRTGRIIPKPPWERRDWKERSVLKDGPQDTVATSATRSTYLPSLLYFHEEIMLLHGIKPSVPKTKPSRRDLILKELQEKQPPTELKEYIPEPGLFMRIYLGLQVLGSKLPFFRK